MTTDPIEPKCREQGSEFLPKFDSNGLLSAVVTHAETAEVLMVAFMDREALARPALPPAGADLPYRRGFVFLSPAGGRIAASRLTCPMRQSLTLT